MKTLGRKPRQLAEVPPLPEELDYLVKWWQDELVGMERLTYAELLAWSKVTQKELLGWEAMALMDIDTIFWNVRNGAQS